MLSNSKLMITSCSFSVLFFTGSHECELLHSCICMMALLLHSCRIRAGFSSGIIELGDGGAQRDSNTRFRETKIDETHCTFIHSFMALKALAPL
jgi:hypothetical protein